MALKGGTHFWDPDRLQILVKTSKAKDLSDILAIT